MQRLVGVVAMLLAIGSVRADVVKVRAFDFGPRDRGILFSMAVTPAGDVLSFVASESGNWALYRIRNWSADKPPVDRLVLLDYASKADRKDLEYLNARVFVTGDGRYAICVGGGFWNKRNAGGRSVEGTARREDLITVVDLSTFGVVSQKRTSELGVFENVDAHLDYESWVVVDSSSFRSNRGAFVRLELPSLNEGPVCRYMVVQETRTRGRKVATSSECQAAVGPGMSFEEYVQKEIPANADVTGIFPDWCKGNSAEFCRWPSVVSKDGKFRVAHRSEGHDDLFGYWRETQRELLVYSVARRAELGVVKLPTNDSTRDDLVFQNGHEYILVMEHGTRLNVYGLRE